MGYIIALVFFVLLVPMLFLLLTRRAGGGREPRSHDHGVTVEQPSSDEPTPGAPGSINQPVPGAERRIPPG